MGKVSKRELKSGEDNKSSKGLNLVIFFSFIFGAVFTLSVIIFSNTNVVEIPIHSFISLIFTISLGAASITLAIVTLNISRISEERLTKRGDESIKLQTELFVKTSNVLSRISSSTTTTVKRIEDIKDLISEKANIMAKDVVPKRLDKEEKEKMIEEISKSLKTEFIPLLSSSPPHVEEIFEKKEMEQKIDEKWNTFNVDLFEEIEKIRGVEIISAGFGDLGAEIPSDFWDIIFKTKNKKIGVDIHISEQFTKGGHYFEFTKDERERERFVRKLIWRSMEDKLDKVFVVSDKNDWENTKGVIEIAKKLKDFVEKYKKPEIILLFGDIRTLATKIKKELKIAS